MKKIKNQKGQAIIEFLFFLPFMLMIYTVVIAIGNSINGSINQQKIARSYLFYRLQNNSFAPRADRGGDRSYMAWNIFGMDIIGWMDHFANNDQPLATCYKLNLPLGQNAEDDCEEAYSEQTTQFIRVGAVFGICGATYFNSSGEIYQLPHAANAGLVTIAATERGCMIQ